MDERVRDSLHDMLAEVASAQRAQLRGADVLAEARARAAASPRRRFWARLAVPRFAVPAFAVCAAAIAVVVWTVRAAPLSFSAASVGFVSAPGRVLEATDAELPIDFSDGSRVALAPGARLTVEVLASAGATLALERGRAELHVTHRESTRWIVKAGPARVAVTGTRFWVSWDPVAEELSVELLQGSVVVSDAPGTSGPERLRAGQTLRASRRRGSFEIVETPAASVESAARPAPALPLALTLAPPAVSRPTPTLAPRARGRNEVAAASLASFRGLAARSRYAEALRAAESVGFDSACETLGSDDVVLLGDVARLAGAPDRAEQAYRAARRRFPSVDRSAFALGVTEFDQRRRYAAAAQWFETYLRQYPTGPLAREAAGRLLESRQRAGDVGGAREAARTYLAQYPAGPHAALARQILSP